MNTNTHRSLGCRLLESHVDAEGKTVYLRLPHGSCVDMGGAIQLATRLHADVLSVVTLQIGEGPNDPDIIDTSYARKTVEDAWVCYPHTHMRKITSAEAIRRVMSLWSKPSEAAPNRLKFWDAADLLKAPSDRRSWVVGMLRSAADILEKNPDGSVYGSVAWRLADAGLELRRIIEASGNMDVPAVHKPTGKGAFLPNSKTYACQSQIAADDEDEIGA